MNKYGAILILGAISFVSPVIADDQVQVTIESLTNADNRAMEVCGNASHPSSAGPLMVTVEHGPASYSTLVSKKGKWCVLIKRWNYSGTVEAEGSLLK